MEREVIYAAMARSGSHEAHDGGGDDHDSGVWVGKAGHCATRMRAAGGRWEERRRKRLVSGGGPARGVWGPLVEKATAVCPDAPVAAANGLARPSTMQRPLNSCAAM